jgi:hypothetical protein
MQLGYRHFGGEIYRNIHPGGKGIPGICSDSTLDTNAPLGSCNHRDVLAHIMMNGEQASNSHAFYIGVDSRVTGECKYKPENHFMISKN